MSQANYFQSLSRCLLIAEIGVNHNGDLELAKRMVVAAKRAGADAVKFQTFTAEALVTKRTPKVRYQETTTAPAESHYDMIQRLELTRPQHHLLLDYCRRAGIEFLSTPYDVDSARFLEELGVTAFKTASADVVDLPLQEFIASTRKPAMVATGMATLGEIERVVSIFDAAKNPDLLLLHCVSNYPCSDPSLNLRAIATLGAAFGTAVGFSDHSEGPLAAALSIALGAKVIEKHFTLDKTMSGPDHRASSTPDEFRELVQQVRRAEVMLGSSRKTPQPEEAQMASVSRKSVVLARSVPAGHRFAPEDLRLMRPGTGIAPHCVGEIVGKTARTNLPALHQLKWTDLADAT